jgi:hypothetical protein
MARDGAETRCPSGAEVSEWCFGSHRGTVLFSLSCICCSAPGRVVRAGVWCVGGVLRCFRLRFVVGCVVAACVVSGAGAQPSTSGGQWVGLTRLGPIGGGLGLRVVVTGAGSATAVWSGPSGVEARDRRADGSWGPVAQLGRIGVPQLGADRSGNVVLVASEEPVAGAPVVSFVHARGSEQWSGPIPVSGSAGAYSEATLAVNDAGQAIAAWSTYEGQLLVTRAAMRASDGRWSAPENLGYSTLFGAPSAAIDQQGNAIVSWLYYSNVQAELRPAGGRWGPATVISPRRQAGYLTPRVVMNRRGDALAVWLENAAGRPALLSSIRRAGTSDWGAALEIPVSKPEKLYEPYTALALDEHANATFIVAQDNGDIEAETLADGASAWEKAVIGSGGGRVCLFPAIAFDQGGGLTVVWGGIGVYSARRAAGSKKWQRPILIESPSGGACLPDIAVDAHGNAVAIWEARAGETGYWADAAVFDTSPPLLEQFAAPSQTRVGQSNSFSVLTRDVWSSQPLWRFGDGRVARGRHVHHVYRRKGRYRVSLTATDLAGNTATSAKTIRVLRPVRGGSQ